MSRSRKGFTRLAGAVLAAVMLLSLCVLNVSAAPAIGSGSAILIDADSGQVLYGKNQTAKMSPAGMTKIMTAIIALEDITDLTQLLPVSSTMLAQVGTGNKSLRPMLVAGETISAADCLYGMLLTSANDAANVLAETVGTTLADFYAMMNAKAGEIGAADTNFANANGLPADNHYTTASDMAKILRYAMTKPEFMTYFGSAEYRIGPTNRCVTDRDLKTSFLMRINSSYTYQYALGGIYGVTSNSGITIAAAAEKDGRRLIAIVLKAETEAGAYGDLKSLFEYGFNEFRQVTVDGSVFGAKEVTLTRDSVKIGTVTFTISQPVQILLRNDVTVESLICSSVDIPNAVDDAADTSAYAGRIHFVDTDGTEVVLADRVALTADKKYDPAATTDSSTEGQTTAKTDASGNVVTDPTSASGSGLGKKIGHFFKVFFLVLLIIVGIAAGLILLFILVLFIIRAVRRKKRRAARERARTQRYKK